jgi:hypothetical protein
LNTMKQQMCTLPLSSSTKSKQGADGFRGFWHVNIPTDKHPS